MNAVLVVVLAVVAVAVLAAAVAARARRRYRAANEVVPGVATTAPAEWAGAHTPEARLHRRLRDAVAALRANAHLDSGGHTDLRLSVERAALDVDERLVTVAALPERVRGDGLADVAAAVEAIEEAVATVAGWSPTGGETALADAVASASERIALVAAARAELDRTYPTTAQAADEAPADEPTEEPPRLQAGDA